MAQQGTHDGVTEDEAALYDRQIRLWGLEAQGKIRTSHILVINLDGLTTEAIKNWVLAGIQRLTLIDFRPHTQWNDLSAGFFWREEDVGESIDRLTPAAARIQALNPLVKIEVLPSSSLKDLLDPSSSSLADLKPSVMVIGIPSGPQSLSAQWNKDSLITLNDRSRQLGIPFYISGSQGFNGFIFSDLGDSHQYVIEKPEVNAPLPASTVEGAALAVPSSSKRLEKVKQEFVPLRKALDKTWKGLPRAQLRRQKPSLGYLGVLALWELSGDGKIPSTEELASTCKSLIEERGLDLKTLLVSEEDFTAFIDALSISLSQPGEFSPTCAMVGGVLSQDVLNAIGGREAPLVNWFQLEGLTGSGQIHALSTPPSSIIPPTAI
ncbi:uncharacterized protein FA14DRAFT_147729 [Meira miltonrushii]|uniref:THIF-type NAD/FAD binding fold domain-containing protein n=1 Tax=Meira miltonrushii TaxID=1280837 RepID=A0A316V8D9_9BASI|nr:uncharacterized protein FA14DRAFT_147729 [Meira miltonrushii]PWN33750.1 hypothetical protein FA14DRAFT_147729 [Meira miltonrushii]